MDFLEISPDKVFPFAIPLFPDNDDELVSSLTFSGSVRKHLQSISYFCALMRSVTLPVAPLSTAQQKKLSVLWPPCFQTCVRLKPLPVDPVNVAVTTKIPLLKLQVSSNSQNLFTFKFIFCKLKILLVTFITEAFTFRTSFDALKVVVNDGHRRGKVHQTNSFYTNTVWTTLCYC